MVVVYTKRSYATLPILEDDVDNDDTGKLVQVINADTSAYQILATKVQGGGSPAQQYSAISGKPVITVSPHGIADSVCTVDNCGADYGIDTSSTTTGGMQEANDYFYNNGISGNVVSLPGTIAITSILRFTASNVNWYGYGTVIQVTQTLVDSFSSGGSYQDVNPIVMTDSTGAVAPNNIHIYGLKWDNNSINGTYTVLFDFWSSNLQLIDTEIINLIGTNTVPNGYNLNVPGLVIDRFRSMQYSVAGTQPAVLVFGGGTTMTNHRVQHCEMNGYIEFDGDATPYSVYEDIIVHGNNVLFDGAGTTNWGNTLFKDLVVFGAGGRSINFSMQTVGAKFRHCYLDGVIQGSPDDMEDCVITQGIGNLGSRFVHNNITFNGTVMGSLAIGTPVTLHNSLVDGNVWTNDAGQNNNTQGGAFFAVDATAGLRAIVINNDFYAIGALFGGVGGSTDIVDLTWENNIMVGNPYISQGIASYGFYVNPMSRIGRTSPYYVRNNLSSEYPTLIPIQTNPPVSGSIYQNLSHQDVIIHIPIDTSTPGTSEDVAIAIGKQTPPTDVQYNDVVPASTTSGNPMDIQLRVPAGYYYSVTTSGAIGTAVIDYL